MDKITIAFVHHTMKRGGGSEQVLYDLIHGLDKEKFRPILCCLYGLGELGQQLQSEGIRTYQNIVYSRYDPRNSLKIASILKREQADILYVTDAFHNMIVGRLAAFVARTPLTVLIFHTYDTVIREGTRPFRRFLLELTDKLFHPRFDRIIALAETHKQYLASIKRIQASKIAVVYNGVDLSSFEEPVNKQAIRCDLAIPETAQMIAMIAGLRRWKSHDTFLSAGAALLREAPNTYFILAGDGPERGRLEKMACDLDMADHVRFLGVVDNVPEILKSVDLSVLTSVHEALPLSLLESMAAACPIVATDVGSVSEIVENGVNGILIPARAPDQLSEAMLRLLQNPELARKYGEAGRKKAKETYSIAGMVRRSESLLLDWMGATR